MNEQLSNLALIQQLLESYKTYIYWQDAGEMEELAHQRYTERADEYYANAGDALEGCKTTLKQLHSRFEVTVNEKE